MAVKFTPIVPPHVQGQGMSELIRHLPITVKADRITFADTSPASLFEVPGNIVITGIDVEIVTAYEASGTSESGIATIEVPGSTGAVVAWNSGTTLLLTATTDAMLSDSIGWVRVPASGGVVTFTQTPGTTTAGAVNVYLSYLPDDTLL
jgi:hypothetical protein